MSHTIPEVVADANELFTALASDLNIDLNLPQLTLPTDFTMPPEEGNPAYAEIEPLTIDQLTTKIVDGTGVFDAMMTTVNAHLKEQFDKNRITGADYAKVYLGSMNAVMQHGTAFLLGKDRAHLENLQLQETIKLTQAQRVRAIAELELVRGQIQQMAFAGAEMRFKAYTSRNQYALSKMGLVEGYNKILGSEAQVKLVHEQYDSARAQTKETLDDGTPVAGLVLLEKALSESKTRLINEQHESQRGQTRGTLSTGEPVSGVLGAQTNLYLEQITSYKRDAESKAVKALLDTWTARKTIDDAVAVPVQIDTPSLDSMILTYRTNLGLTVTP